MNTLRLSEFTTYNIYNMKELNELGFYPNNRIPQVYTYCAFCKAYTYHVFWQRHTRIIVEELSVCVTCNNCITPDVVK